MTGTDAPDDAPEAPASKKDSPSTKGNLQEQLSALVANEGARARHAGVGEVRESDPTSPGASENTKRASLERTVEPKEKPTGGWLNALDKTLAFTTPMFAGETVSQILNRLTGSPDGVPKPTDTAMTPGADRPTADVARAINDVWSVSRHPPEAQDAKEVLGVVERSLDAAVEKAADTYVDTLDPVEAVKEGLRRGLVTGAKEAGQWLWDKLSADMREKPMLAPLAANFPAGMLDGLADKFGVPRRPAGDNPYYKPREAIYREGYALAAALEAQLSPQALRNINECMHSPARADFEKSLSLRVTVELLARASQHTAPQRRHSK